MKFGKRLAAEASRRWRPFYLDYKALKRALARDVSNKGAPRVLNDSIYTFPQTPTAPPLRWS